LFTLSAARQVQEFTEGGSFGKRDRERVPHLLSKDEILLIFAICTQRCIREKTEVWRALSEKQRISSFNGLLIGKREVITGDTEAVVWVAK